VTDFDVIGAKHLLLVEDWSGEELGSDRLKLGWEITSGLESDYS
jgi:hypothetical protein